MNWFSNTINLYSASCSVNAAITNINGQFSYKLIVTNEEIYDNIPLFKLSSIT